ncbi:MAG: arginine--tRNA ligase, partial [Candidatus Gastranaerophilales bacterium]|nr:arginine--tRNA ligase [Candidatus Gastranaerophilales bacterium]
SPLARYAKLPPAKIAETICRHIDIDDIDTSCIAGFINFKAGKNRLSGCIEKIISKADDFGRNDTGNGEKVMLEYVSANPTGPLHIGHGRWAAVGSALAELMKFSGYDVYQEFYINDYGNQMNRLFESFLLRLYQLNGHDLPLPEDEIGKKNYYPGEYLVDLAKKYLNENPNSFEKIKECIDITHYDAEAGLYVIVGSGSQPVEEPPASIELRKELLNYIKGEMLEQQRNLLSRLGVHFDNWFSETTLHEQGKVEEAIKKLENAGKTYEQDGALWFRSTEYGDDQNRVIIKNDGKYTYLTADIAYHFDKLERGFERLINIWGADHHGYVARIKAAIEALGKDSSCLEVLLGQLVNLIISGEQVRMGKRRKMVTLEELVDEVGTDGTRFWMIMRDINTTLDFDVDLAMSCSDENPVYYAQYAHARLCSILRTAVSERPDRETGNVLPPLLTADELARLFAPATLDASLLSALWKTEDEKELESTKNLILRLESFDDLVVAAAKGRTPYMIARYTQDLAKDFH